MVGIDGGDNGSGSEVLVNDKIGEGGMGDDDDEEAEVAAGDGSNERLARAIGGTGGAVEAAESVNDLDGGGGVGSGRFELFGEGVRCIDCLDVVGVNSALSERVDVGRPTPRERVRKPPVVFKGDDALVAVAVESVPRRRGLIPPFVVVGLSVLPLLPLALFPPLALMPLPRKPPKLSGLVAGGFSETTLGATLDTGLELLYPSYPSSSPNFFINMLLPSSSVVLSEYMPEDMDARLFSESSGSAREWRITVTGEV